MNSSNSKEVYRMFDGLRFLQIQPKKIF